MLEIEKKFQPTEEQLQRLLEGSVLLKETEMTEIFYDHPDYRCTKNKILVRSRNGKFEVKTDVKDVSAGTAKLRREIEDEKEILAALGYSADENLSEVMERDFIELCRCATSRKTYKKEGFTIDIDATDFGYHICEIELLVETGDQVKEAEEKIVAFAKRFELASPARKMLKAVECIRATNPALYETLYGKE